MIKVGLIGCGVVGKRRAYYISKQKNLNLRYVSDIKFKKILSRKNFFFLEIIWI